MVLAALMVSLGLVNIPLSSAYDFIGDISARGRSATQETLTEEVVESPVVEEETPVEPIVEELVEEPAPETEEQLKEEVVEKPQETVLPEPQIEEEPEVNYTEIDYKSLAKGNPLDNLPQSASGNYVIIYRTSVCTYCDKLIDSLKGNIGDYHLVVVNCAGGVDDLFYDRWIYYFPGFIVIKDKVVRYYGYGYRTLEEFKKLL